MREYHYNKVSKIKLFPWKLLKIQRKSQWVKVARKKCGKLFEQANKVLEEPTLITRAAFITSKTPYDLREIQEQLSGPVFRIHRPFDNSTNLAIDVQTYFRDETGTESTQEQYDLVVRAQRAFIARIIAFSQDRHFSFAANPVLSDVVEVNSLQEDARLCQLCCKEFTDSLTAIKTESSQTTRPLALKCTASDSNNRHIFCTTCVHAIADNARRGRIDFLCPLCKSAVPMIVQYKEHEVEVPLGGSRLKCWWPFLMEYCGVDNEGDWRSRTVDMIKRSFGFAGPR